MKSILRLFVASSLAAGLTVLGLAQTHYTLAAITPANSDVKQLEVTGVSTNDTLVGNCIKGEYPGNYIYLRIAGIEQFDVIPDGTQLDQFGSQMYLQFTYACGVNNCGTVVGFCPQPDTNALYVDEFNRQTVGFVLQDGVFQGTIAAPSPYSTFATGVNDSGTICGYYEDETYVLHGFTYKNKKFTMTDYRAVDGSETQLAGINNNGTVVGTAFVPVGDGSFNTVPFLMHKKDTVTLTLPPDLVQTTATCINVNDQVGGWTVTTEQPDRIQGFVNSNGVYTVIDATPVATAAVESRGNGPYSLVQTATTVTGINNNGVAVGFVDATFTDADHNQAIVEINFTATPG